MKPIKILIILYLFVSSFITKAQGGDMKIQTTSDGNTFSFGFFAGELMFNNGDDIGNPNSPNEGYFLALIDSSGYTLFTRHIRTNASINSYGIYPGLGLCRDNQDNVYLTGNFIDSILFNDTSSLNAPTMFQTFIAKYDYAGNLLWAAMPSGCHESQGTDVALDMNGNLFNAGTFRIGTFTFGTLPPLNWSGEFEDIYLVKFDNAGNAQWLQQLYTNNGSTTLFSITTDSLGNSYLIGKYGDFYGTCTLHFGDLIMTKNSDWFEIFIAKCDPFGEPVWLKSINNLTGSDTPEEIVADDLGNIYITGNFGLTSQFGLLPPLIAKTNDVFIANYNYSGDAIWVNQASPFNEGYQNFSKGIDIDSYGNVLTIGEFSDTIEFPPFPPISNWTGMGFIVKHDKLGNALCVNTDTLYFDDISTDSFGNAYTINGLNEIQGTNLTVTKWDNYCNKIWSSTILHFWPVGYSEYKYEKTVHLFPNPTSGSLTVEFFEHLNDPVKIEIIDYSGKKLIEQYITSGDSKTIIDLTVIKKGIYIFKAISTEGTFIKKLIKF